MCGRLVMVQAGGGKQARSQLAVDDGIRARIEATLGNLAEAVRQQDPAAVAHVYTTTGQLFPPNRDMVQGRADIQLFWQTMFDAGLRDAVLDTVEVDSEGATAVEVGRYAFNAAGGAVIDFGKYLFVWKHEQGRWRLDRSIWNTNRP